MNPIQELDVLYMLSRFRPYDKRMFECFSGRAPLLRIQVQATIEQVDKEIQFLDLGISHPLHISH